MQPCRVKVCVAKKQEEPSAWHNFVKQDNFIPGWQSHPKVFWATEKHCSNILEVKADISHKETPRHFCQTLEKSQVSLNYMPQTGNFWGKNRLDKMLNDL